MGTEPGARQDLDAALGQVLGCFQEIAAAWLFGSVARQDAGPRSDVDLGLVFRQRGDTTAT